MNMVQLKQYLITLELKLIEPEVRRCKATLNQLITEDFMEYPASGGAPYLKADVYDRLAGEILFTVTQQDYQLRVLADDVAQLVYRAKIFVSGRSDIKYSHRSSIYKYNGTQWQMQFHQGTPCDVFS
ncbi:hypothetical protein CJF42_06350 [Pseudoalteromonas sp. NBT06-2]|uniref:nuclear transport factor 2 family protein n=1 Tax=Pseudoalteromonas sp. NBT06-2 TaxID=2025950 RepID=UPI000BA5CF57|nr:DUF4440 domain-containing protein [Pseudoalteromonas sp. NBT06-2]PAJ75265.1 hypothetical protein CJF42_06350 [Pseudoalteromonas sp. NBT06-2]